MMTRLRLMATAVLLLYSLLNSSMSMGQSDEPTKSALDKTKKKTKKKKFEELYYPSLGLGKTLPGDYYRIRVYNRYTEGDRLYDDKGKPQDIGYKLSAQSAALSVEYGLNEDLSLLILAPFVTKNTVAFNGQHYRDSARYAQNKAYYENLLFGRLQASGQCADIESCRALAQTNTPLKAGSDLVLPSGERVDFSGVPASQVLASIPNILTKAAAPQDGSTGLGDIDLGLTSVVYSNPKHVLSIGLGVRLPTGEYENVPFAQRPTGQGMMQGGVRLNYDWHVIPALWISYQHQFEYMLKEGKRYKSSNLDPNKLNEADPTTQEAILAGSNGEPNLQTVRRKGIAHTGVLRADYGLSDISRSLQTLSIEAALNFEKGAEEYLGDTRSLKAPERYVLSYGAKFDGLGLKKPVPGYVRVMRDRFLEGRNLPLATSTITLEFGYYVGF
ncbi:MAG: hypothetical protein EOP10_17105 [Proteobacteria bacterium]|nr:MAG: hypothetical protein EOP10_17105 [Pseudomonadota bacterium]